MRIRYRNTFVRQSRKVETEFCNTKKQKSNEEWIELITKHESKPKGGKEKVDDNTVWAQTKKTKYKRCKTYFEKNREDGKLHVALLQTHENQQGIKIRVNKNVSQVLKKERIKLDDIDEENN